MSEDISAIRLSEPAALDARSLYAMFAGLCASLVAIGLARFAYTPLIPPLIQAHWFTSSQAVTLGAANFAGYLAGALLGRPDRVGHVEPHRAATPDADGDGGVLRVRVSAVGRVVLRLALRFGTLGRRDHGARRDDGPAAYPGRAPRVRERHDLSRFGPRDRGFRDDHPEALAIRLAGHVDRPGRSVARAFGGKLVRLARISARNARRVRAERGPAGDAPRRS